MQFKLSATAIVAILAAVSTASPHLIRANGNHPDAIDAPSEKRALKAYGRYTDDVDVAVAEKRALKAYGRYTDDVDIAADAAAKRRALSAYGRHTDDIILEDSGVSPSKRALKAYGRYTDDVDVASSVEKREPFSADVSAE